MYEATYNSNILERIQIGVKICHVYQNFSDLITKKISDRRPDLFLKHLFLNFLQVLKTS